MIIFWRLLFGHFLADFTFQANWVNRIKRESALGMLVHVFMHPVFYVALTYPYLFDTWVRFQGISINGIWAIAFITLLHYLEDFWRVYTIKKFNTPDNTLYLLWDQIIHVSVIFAFFGSGPGAGTENLVEIWPIIGILAIGATHFSVVLVYFLEFDFLKRPYPDTGEKYLAILERGLAFTCLTFISTPWLAWITALISLLAPRMELRILLKARPLPNLGWALGGLTAIACGLGGRYLLQ